MSTIWYCYAAGTRHPKRRHGSLEAAMAEAARLSALPDIKSTVYVLADVASFPKVAAVELATVVAEKTQPAEPVVTTKKKKLLVLP